VGPQRRELREAQERLAGRDAVVDRLVMAHGPCRLPAPVPVAERFGSLARSIVAQQLHGSAAASIWARVEALEEGPLRPSGVLRAGPEGLRACGLSLAKARAITALALAVRDGELRLERIGRLGDEAVVEQLTRVWGVGPWTAQMFLMFSLGRLDVWPTGDLGVRAGWSVAFGISELPSPSELEDQGRRFAGVRSLVAWYCWRALEAARSATG
jgi:DNA-3-methyladenine glycosylase II